MNRLGFGKNIMKALCVTALAFVLSYLIHYDFSSISYFAPLEKASDFELSDFLQIVAHEQGAHHLDEEVVVVNVDGCDRQGIADVLMDLAYLQPKCVGIDILFDTPRQGDSVLLEAVDALPCAVMACEISVQKDGHMKVHDSYFTSLMPQLRRGAVTWNGEDMLSVIREIPLSFAVGVAETDTVQCFETALLEAAADPSLQVLRQRGTTDEIIDYSTYMHTILRPHQLLEAEERVRGKYVLVGIANKSEDLHATPVNRAMPGVMIHAQALSTLLHGAYYRFTPEWLDWLLAIVLCVFMVALKYAMNDKKYADLLIRIVQFLMLCMILFLGYAFFLRWRIVIGFSASLLMVALGLMAKEVADALWWLVTDKIKK